MGYYVDVNFGINVLGDVIMVCNLLKGIFDIIVGGYL